jgi:hypothetical protein
MGGRSRFRTSFQLITPQPEPREPVCRTADQQIGWEGRNRRYDQSLAGIDPAQNNDFIDQIDDDCRDEEPGHVMPALACQLAPVNRIHWQVPSHRQGARLLRPSAPHGSQSRQRPSAGSRAETPTARAHGRSACPTLASIALPSRSLLPSSSGLLKFVKLGQPVLA